MLPAAPLAPSPADNLEDRVLALGREGYGRAEIADVLEVSEAGLRALEAGRPGLAAAMARAEGAARAWWERAAREAMAAGVRSGMSGWRAAIAWRFGAAKAQEDRAAALAAATAQRTSARVELPDNGRERDSLRHRDPAAWAAQERERVLEEIELLQDELACARSQLEDVDRDLAELADEGDADEPDES